MSELYGNGNDAQFLQMLMQNIHVLVVLYQHEPQKFINKFQTIFKWWKLLRLNS
jgi:hypothetical protein